MKKILKLFKWLGLGLLSILFIGIIYLAITGFPKPSTMTTENVPRLPFKILKTAQNAKSESSNYLIMKGWSRKKGEGIYVMVNDGFSQKLAVISEPGAEPKIIEGWSSTEYGMNAIFSPDPEANFFLYTKDITEGSEKTQIFSFDMTTKESTMLSNGKAPHGSPRFTRDGKQIIYSVRNEETLNSNLYIRDIENLESERLLLEGSAGEAKRGFYVDDFSPDGKHIVLRQGYYAREPSILNLETGVLTLLHPDHASGASYSYHEWSEDGNKIYYGTTYQADHRQLRVRDLITGSDSVLVKNLNWSISNINESPDGNWLVFNTNEDGIYYLHFYHVPTGKREIFDAIPGGSVNGYTSFNPNENALLAFPVTNADNQTDLFTYNLENKKLSKWTNNFTEIEYPLPEVIQYPTFDIDSLTGETRNISAVYFRPKAEIEKPYPVIVWIHGGPEDQSKPSFDPLVKTYLDKGYATLKPNVRGSSNYGFTFRKLDDGKLRENAVKDIGALLDWIKTQPELDQDNVVAWGGSYGGYMSLATAVHYSDKLKGVVAYCGPTDFVSSLESEDRNADRSPEYGDVSDPEMREFLTSISPVNNGEKITVPVFIYQGAQDSRVTVDQGRKMVEALKQADKEYWYLEAANEGHFAKNPWNFIYLTAAEIEFIDRAFDKVK